MENFTVGTLLNRTWYVAEIIIKDEKDNVLFNGENYKTQSCLYASILQRWVNSIGIFDNKLVIVVI